MTTVEVEMGAAQEDPDFLTDDIAHDAITGHGP
jgi:hypothetical protein